VAAVYPVPDVLDDLFSFRETVKRAAERGLDYQDVAPGNFRPSRRCAAFDVQVTRIYEFEIVFDIELAGTEDVTGFVYLENKVIDFNLPACTVAVTDTAVSNESLRLLCEDDLSVDNAPRAVVCVCMRDE